MKVRRLVTTAVVVLLLAGGPGAAAGVTHQAGRDAGPATPPAGVDFDYQLGGPRPVPGRVGIVVRDRKDSPLPGAYNVCYVNGFQTQPDEKGFWRATPRRWRLVLKDGGRPVVDEDWGEWLLDIRTGPRRQALARIVGRWEDRCAEDGYDAVELDNLDSFSRSRGLLRPRQNRRFARLLTARAHRSGLAVAQKNWAELGSRGPGLGFDFAIAEECARWHECGSYARAYGDRVLVVEYRPRPFRRACRRWGDRLAVVRRDRDLSPTGLRRWCSG